VAKVPRLGEPQHARLCYLLGKIATAGTVLDNADRAWLVELLDSIRLGEDVSKRFTKNGKPSPQADLHFWIACDVAQHLHDRKRGAHAAVAKRWAMDNVTGPDSVAKIVTRQRSNTDAVTHLLGDGFAAVIEYHRVRLIGHKSR
jgi:hypothetical protein